MACSKLFSGDLPELTDEIIQYFRNDYKTLYSCALVNRFWSRLTIPLLWEDPSSLRFIEIYLYRLNDNDKDKLNNYWDKSNPYSNTLFNYPSFIKYLNTKKFIISINSFINEEKLSNRIKNSDNVERIICDLIIKLFIENEVNLNTFELEVIIDDSLVSFELLLECLKFICDMKNLESFYFQMAIMDYDEYNNKIEEFLMEIIKSQQNLKNISFENVSLNDFLSLENNMNLPISLFTNSNCLNTLNKIIFFDTDFKNVELKAIESLNVLESIHILYCINLNSDFIQQIISFTKPFKLKSLFMKTKIQIRLLESLLQKSCDYLENIGFELSMYKSGQLEPIINQCTKIRYFELVRRINNQMSFPALNLIKNFGKTLNFLSIEFCRYSHVSSNDIRHSSNIFLKLGEILPPKLEYLSLSLMINARDFNTFLFKTRNIIIKKLLIENLMKEGDLMPYIKEHVMKEKRVRYLAINGGVSENDIKEFESYNIKIVNFDDFYIRAYEFVNEMY
ncbi:uncharacterized protein OCT59_019130 [Rhizophagus irregularis]|uniref:uncharacterized protein n=1 Tax=Rhizophagus irregularis TaxID=588596 RepID=UPI000CA90E81|nr:hypothetical protein OCT59_019130 [Rhizophagus irregularis]GBC33971.1 hypothetical protein GLOIN_2v1877448 [Rhizophagus irregularis DAOM 181602=DAOM 197198]